MNLTTTLNHTGLKTSLILLLSIVFATSLHSQNWKPEHTEWYHPVPPTVTPGEGTEPPSDAIILFDGTDLSNWEDKNGGEVEWKIKDGALVVTRGSGPIRTKQLFGDSQLHIEWRVPSKVENKGQNRGNSGVFLQDRYEVQMLDSYENPTYVNGQAGSIYKQKAPLVNASKEPGEWQIYDIIWSAPKFGTDGKLEAPAEITVIHNGVVIQNNYELKGNTPYIGLPSYEPHGLQPIRLQDHDSEVEFRNIWIRNL